MKYLIGFVALLAFVAIEMEIYAFGFHYGYKTGYDTGYVKGSFDALQIEHETRINFILDRMAFYESSYNVVARGDYDGTRYHAYGLYQFHRPTFMWLARLSGNPKLDWKNPEHQHRVAKWAIRHGYGYLWKKSYRHALHDLFERGVG